MLLVPVKMLRRMRESVLERKLKIMRRKKMRKRKKKKAKRKETAVE